MSIGNISFWQNCLQNFYFTFSLLLIIKNFYIAIFRKAKNDFLKIKVERVLTIIQISNIYLLLQLKKASVSEFRLKISD